VRKTLALTLVLLLPACASLPENFPQRPSQAWPEPEATHLGTFFRGHAPASGPRSGVRLVADPRDAFKARYAFAALAEHTLDLQYYLWKGDLTGRLLLWRALQAADRGVQVRILMDDIYHHGRDRAYAAIDAHPNMQVRVFNPMGNRGVGRSPNFLVNKRTLNHRMHNKIFLVDNAVAILGGRNIGDDYFGIDPDLNFHDLDVLAVGAAAQAAGQAFDMYWNSPYAVPIEVLYDRTMRADELDTMRLEMESELSEALGGIPYDVPHDALRVQQQLEQLANELTWAEAEIVVDPLDRFDGGSESAFVKLGRSLNEEAEHDLTMQTAYLIPNGGGIDNISHLIDKGVRVRIMTNSSLSNNHLTVHAHYMKYRKPLIRAGAELHELRADAELLNHYREVDSRIADSHAGLHTKALVVDGRISVIGSYNMDPRSRIWNSEIALLVRSEAFGEIVMAEMLEEFAPGNSYRVNLDERGKLYWEIETDAGTERWTHDPGATVWRRFLARLISWLPIENEL
jgi:putative cardiolipin synthase